MADSKQYLDVTGLRRLSVDFKEVFVEQSEIQDTIIEGSEGPVSSGAVYLGIEQVKEEVKSYMRFGTKEFWDSLPQLVAIKDCVYFYTDCYILDDYNIARMKIGDGTSLLKDIPFVDELYYSHINNSLIHVAPSDRDSWDNKINAAVEGDTLILTTN